MKTLNKTLSLILALAMVFGLMGVASAAFTDQSTITHTTAVDTCVALNIINGYNDGSYAPSAPVTRAELCKMICTAYNGGVTPTLAATATPTYTDTANHWASAYIEYCTKLGIVSGTGNGMFDPDGTVTGTQAAKMMLVALGFNAANEGFTGTNWDVAVNVRANEKKLYDQLVNFDPGTGLNRDNAAQMIYNMLYATEVEYTYSITTDASGAVKTTPVLKDKTITVDGTTSKVEFVEDKYDLSHADGIVTDVTYNDVNKLYTINVDAGYTVKVNNVDTEVTYALRSSTDYESFYRQKVRILYDSTVTDANKANVYGVVAYNSSVILSGVIGQLTDSTDLQTNMTADATLVAASGAPTSTSFKLNGTTYKFDSTTKMFATPLYQYLDTNASTKSTFGASFVKLATAANVLKAVKYKAVTIDTTTTMQTTDPNTTATYYKGTITDTVYKAYQATYHMAAYTFKMIDNNGDNKIDVMVVTPVDVAQITSVSSTKVTTTNTVGTTGSYTFDDDSIYTGAAKLDYAKITASANTVDGKAKLEKITPFDGKVTETTDTKATIGGVAMGYFANLEVGKSYTGLDQANGFIWAFKSAAGNTSATDYAVVVTAGDSGAAGSQAKLLLSDGTKKLVDTKVSYSGDAGKLVNISKDSSDVYTLSTDSDDLQGSFDIGVTAADTGVTACEYSSTGANAKAVTTTDSNNVVTAHGYIADDAVVFVNVHTNATQSEVASDSYKVMTGAAFKTVSSATINNAYGVKDTSTGYASFSVVYAKILNTTATGDTLYGYVTSGVTVTTLPTDATVKCNKVTFWDGSATKTLYTDKVYAGLDKNMIFQYTLNTDGNMVIAIPAADGHTATASYVTAINDSKVSINGNSGSSKVSSTDTKVMYINSDSVEGLTSGSVSYFAAADGVKNVIYLDGKESTDPFVLIVYDMANAANTASIYGVA